MIVQPLTKNGASPSSIQKPSVSSGIRIVQPLTKQSVAPQKPLTATSIVSKTKPVVTPPKKVKVTEQSKGFLDTVFSGAQKLIKNVELGAQLIPGNIQTGVGVFAKGQTLEGNKKQVQKYKDLEKRAQERGDKKAADMYKKLIGAKTQGLKDIDTFSKSMTEGGRAKNKPVLEEKAKLGKSEGVQGFFEDVAFNAPSLVTSLGVAGLATVISKNPVLGISLGFAPSYAQNAADVYNEAKDSGVSEDKAVELGNTGGVIMGAIDAAPIGRLITKSPIGSTLKKSLAKNIIKELQSVGTQAVLEGGTEASQQVIANALARTYNENKNLLDGVKDAALIGAFLGGASDVTVDASIAFTDKITGDKTIKEGEKKIQEAFTTAPEKRTEQQQKIVDTYLKQDLTPQQVINNVINTPIEKTTEGKIIVKTAIQAQKEGKMVQFSQDEKTKEVELKIVDKKITEQLPKDDSVKEPQSSEIDTFEKNVQDYRSFGGYSAGTETENAALRDVTKLSDSKLVKEYTQKQVQDAITSGALPVDAEGNITLYRGGEPSDVNQLASATYDKKVAERFADNAGGVLHEFKVKPEDIRAFIGRDEAEVLVDKSVVKKDEINQVRQETNKNLREMGVPESEIPKPVIPEESPKETAKEDVITRNFDEKGNEITEKQEQRVINTKEVRAVISLIDEKLTVIREGSSDPKDLSTKYEEFYNDILEKANNDKVVLSSLRTALNKEMFGIAGVQTGGANYRAAYAQLQAMMDDPEIGGVLSQLEYYVSQLDEKLLTAQEPGRVTPIVPKEPRVATGKTITTPSKENPVGTGKLKDSKLFKRVKETVEGELRDYMEAMQVKHNELSLDKQSDAVARLIDTDPQRAVRIAKGLEEPPAEMTQNAVALGLAEVARAEGDWKTTADFWAKTSLRSSRLGKEIVSLRGGFGENTPLNAVKRVLDARIDQITKRYGDIIKGLALPEDATPVQKVDALVKHQAKRLKKEMVSKLQSADELFAALTCK